MYYNSNTTVSTFFLLISVIHAILSPQDPGVLSDDGDVWQNQSGLITPQNDNSTIVSTDRSWPPDNEWPISREYPPNQCGPAVKITFSHPGPISADPEQTLNRKRTILWYYASDQHDLDYRFPPVHGRAEHLPLPVWTSIRTFTEKGNMTDGLRFMLNRLYQEVSSHASCRSFTVSASVRRGHETSWQHASESQFHFSPPPTRPPESLPSSTMIAKQLNEQGQGPVEIVFRNKHNWEVHPHYARQEGLSLISKLQDQLRGQNPTAVDSDWWISTNVGTLLMGGFRPTWGPYSWEVLDIFLGTDRVHELLDITTLEYFGLLRAIGDAIKQWGYFSGWDLEVHTNDRNVLLAARFLWPRLKLGIESMIRA